VGSGNLRNVKKDRCRGKFDRAKGLAGKAQITDDGCTFQLGNVEARMQRHSIRHILVVTAFCMASGAQASSGDAWKDFANEVQGKCEIAARDQIEFPHAVVDPFGSEHFGMALVTGKPKGANGFVSYFCVYDKTTNRVELGTELETERMGILPDE
jgi:hypothetical protein